MPVDRARLRPQDIRLCVRRVDGDQADEGREGSTGAGHVGHHGEPLLVAYLRLQRRHRRRPYMLHHRLLCVASSSVLCREIATGSIDCMRWL